MHTSAATDSSLHLNRASTRWTALAAGAALACLTLAAHSPALQGGFVWDDLVLVTENPLLKAPDALYRFWFTTQAPDYFPLTNTVFWAEWRLWGNRPEPYHTVNIALHVLSTVLLWRVLRRLKLSAQEAFL